MVSSDIIIRPSHQGMVWNGMEDNFSIFHTGNFLLFHVHSILITKNLPFLSKTTPGSARNNTKMQRPVSGMHIAHG